MSKDRLEDLENKYWKGKSSLEDEQSLKAREDNVYFKKLKAAKEEQLEWGFDEFLFTAREGGNKKELVYKRITKPIWKYIGVAAALLVVGLFFLKNRSEEPKVTGDEKPYVRRDVEKKSPINTSHDISDQENEEEKPAELTRIAKQKIEMKQVVPAEMGQAVRETEEAYVMVNGEPVYDAQEAEQIILASLQLVVSNFQEGRQAVEKIKYIKVEL